MLIRRVIATMLLAAAADSSDDGHRAGLGPVVLR